MYETTRGIATLVGAAVAGFLIWLAAQMGDDSAGEYWATYGLIAAAGLAMALSQVLGGWTKWGWPRLGVGVFVLGFLPVAVLGLWVLFSRQPGDQLLDTGAWSRDLGVDGVVADLGELLAAVAFGMGLTLGFTFDTTGPRLPQPGQPLARDEATAVRRDERDWVDRGAADEPLTAERRDQGIAPDEARDRVDDPPRRVIRP